MMTLKMSRTNFFTRYFVPFFHAQICFSCLIEMKDANFCAIDRWCELLRVENTRKCNKMKNLLFEVFF